MTETQDERADRLAALAIELVSRVRDYSPEANGRWLASMVGPDDWVGFAIVLACAVPLDVPWRHLTRWVTLPATEEVREMNLCPSADAYRRHLRAGEEPDEGCKQAYREHERDRVARYRAGRRAA